MNEAVRPRFAVDLDEIERQLAQAPAAPAAAPVNRNDPLAELARIVGQDDPFQSLLGSERGRPQAKDPAGLDDLFVAPERSGRPQGPAYQDYRGNDDAGAARSARHAEPSHAFPEYPPHQAGGQGGYADAGYGDAYYGDGGTDEYPPLDDSAYQPVKKRRSRKGVLALGLLATVAVIGGGLWLTGGGSGILSSGEPPLVTANNEPVKVQPQSPGGLEIPNQNKQIYERADQDAKTRVVNREEQPVDVRQAIRSMSGDNAAQPGGEAQAVPSQPQSTGGLNLGEPRRVRTVAIRPDGTIIGAEPPASRPAPVPPPPSMPAAAQPQAVPAAPAAAPSPQRPAAAPPRMVLPQIPAGGSSPQAPAPAAAPSEPQRMASAQVPEVPAEPAAAAPAPSGGFAVQLAVSSSEAEAQTIFGRLQDKYADLSGQTPIIRKAEVNGRTLYRVRVGPMSRDDASSLCSKLQGQGGECFVARN
jgi:cell division septation protein DedD